MSINLEKIKHIGIILDGNGRWAKQRNKIRSFGHKVGSENVINIVNYVNELELKYLTLYVFSTENWKRSNFEVNFLMNLLCEFIEIKLQELYEKNCKLNILGNIDNLPKKVINSINKSIEKTRYNTGLNLNIAINYGGRSEIIEAVKNIIESNIKSSDITDELFESYLYTKNIPDPDLIIRTGGEIRLSNFLTYQSAYSELYFTDILWPDFKRSDLDDAIEEFNKRNRRFGNI